MDLGNLGIAIIGCGYWGSNFIRIVQNTPQVRIVALCDTDSDKLKNLTSLYPNLILTDEYDTILNDCNIDAVIICTPVITHFKITNAFLKSGKHVLCEKPLDITFLSGLELAQLAKNSGLTLLVGHVFEYHSIFKYMKKLVSIGTIGKIQYLHFTRMGLGLQRSDVNVVFDLAAHDVGMAISLLGIQPVAVSANGFGFNIDGQEEVAFLQLEFPDKVFVLIDVSWIDPIKQRVVKVVGTKKMLVFDDVSTSEKLKIIDIGNSYHQPNADYGSFQMAVKDGDIIIPNVPTSEPLVEEFIHFIECIKYKGDAITDGIYASNVIKVLEAANQSLRKNGERIWIN
jgi:predicted dehydrogenase